MIFEQNESKVIVRSLLPPIVSATSSNMPIDVPTSNNSEMTPNAMMGKAMATKIPTQSLFCRKNSMISI